METDLIIEVEKLVDKHSLLNVLTALENMCLEKGAHIRMNWQDVTLARRWDRVSRKLYSAAQLAASEDL